MYPSYKQATLLHHYYHPTTTDQMAAITFSAWAALHGRTYTPTEAVLRREIFAANVAKIERHNAEAAQGVHSWTVRSTSNHCSILCRASYVGDSALCQPVNLRRWASTSSRT